MNIDPIYNPMHVIMCLEKCIGNKRIRHDDAVNTMRDALTLINSYSDAIAKLQNENNRLTTVIKTQQSETEATLKQLEFIKIIEEYVCEKFTGKTRGEASVWISRHYDEYKKARKKENEEMNENTWAIEHGYF